MIQLANPASIGLTPSEVVTGLAAVFSMALNWRFAASVSSMKLEMKLESDKLRVEISDKLSRLEDGFTRRFVPGDLAAEQRAALVMRVDKLEAEVNKNRDRIHDLSSQFQQLMLGPMQQIQTVLTDKARRMARYEERAETAADDLRDFEERLTLLERDSTSK